MKKSLDFVLSLVTAERERQVAKGYDAAHDAKHTEGELAAGAAAYALPPYLKMEYAARLFPWVGYYRKEASRVTEVVKALAMLTAEAQRLLSAPQFGIATKLITELNADNGANFQVASGHFIQLAEAVEMMLAAGADFSEETIYELATGSPEDEESKLRFLPGFGEMARALNLIFEAGSPPDSVPLHYDATAGVPDLSLDNTAKPVNFGETQEVASRLLAAFNKEMGITSVVMPASNFELLTQAVAAMQRAGFVFTDEAITTIAETGLDPVATKTPGWQYLVAVFEGHIGQAEESEKAALTAHQTARQATTTTTTTTTGGAGSTDPNNAFADNPQTGRASATTQAVVDSGLGTPAEAVATTGAPVSQSNPGGGFGQTMGEAAVAALAPNGNIFRAPNDAFLADEPRPGSELNPPAVGIAPGAGGPADSATESKATAGAKDASAAEDGQARKRGPGRPPAKG